MKNRGLLNPFSQKTKDLFFWDIKCWLCGSNQVADGHHIVGRSNSSPLNLAPLCRKCHDIGNIHSQYYEIKLLAKTMEYLIKQGYHLKQKDIDFIEKNIDLYQDILVDKSA